MQIPLLPASPRFAMTATYTAFGTGVGALAGSMPVVTRAAGIGDFYLGLAITASTLCTVATLSAGGAISRFASNRAMLLWSLPLFALSLLATLTAASPILFVIVFLWLGLMFGLTDVFMNAEGTAIETDLGKPIFSLLHACVSLGMPVMALIASHLSTEVGTWATGLVVSVFFAVAWAQVRANIPARSLARGRTAKLSGLPNKTPMVLLGIAIGLIVAAETTAILWSAKLLDAQAPELAAIAGAGAAFFGICNAAVRVRGDWLRARFGDLPLMMVSLLIATAGFAAFGFSQSFAASVASFAVIGFGTAALVPCAIAIAAAHVPGNRAAGISFISVMSAVPRIAAPWVFGWLVSTTSFSLAFSLFAAVLVVALVLIVALRNLKRQAPGFSST